LASVEQQDGRHAEAVGCLRQGLKAVPESERNRLLLCLLDVQIQGDALAEAEELLGRLRQEGAGPLLDFHEARILVSRGEWRRAALLLERVRPQLVQSPELGVSLYLLLAECAAKLGDPDQELDCYEKAANLDPGSGPARRGLGSAMLARGRADVAVREFRRM